MGCVLGQRDETRKKEHDIYYLSKKCTYVENVRTYLLCLNLGGSSIEAILVGKISRWQVMLSEYDITYVIQKAIKGSALVDYLANQLVDDYKSMQCEFSNEGIMVLSEQCHNGKWTLLFDGASNIMGHGNMKLVPCEFWLLLKENVLEVYGDSTIVIYQLNQEWETRDKKFIPYLTT
ncbi:uncharacterized protein [Cicer arietinum]|uniref:Uncharacterized protein LOC113784118 n=1 Tax=Cicer arietinum TaxID=3827 RepID=A0A3Q7XI72_CICAR|nr:uncharacterized protein LOC113784118 [Cicer arietinum]